MSIWSKNHEELAKLAQTLEQRNVRTRRRLGKESDELGTWPNQRLAGKRSRSDSNLHRLSSSESFSRNGFHDLSLIGVGVIEDDTSARLRMDSFSSGDSAISPDFTRGSILSPTSILKLSHNSRVARNGFHPGKYDNLATSPRNLDKKVTFLLRAGSDDNMEMNIRDKDKIGVKLYTKPLNVGSEVEKDVIFSYQSNGCDIVNVDENSEENIEVEGDIEKTTFKCSNSNGMVNDDGHHDSVHKLGVSERLAAGPSGDNKENVPSNGAINDRVNGFDDSHSFNNCDECVGNGVGSGGVKNAGDEVYHSPCDIPEDSHSHSEPHHLVNGILNHSSKSLIDTNSPSITSNGVGEESRICRPEKETYPNGEENIGSYKSSTSLNISDDLNLLLISLLTNHKKEKILESVRDESLSKQEPISECNGGCINTSVNHIDLSGDIHFDGRDGNDVIESIEASATGVPTKRVETDSQIICARNETDNQNLPPHSASTQINHSVSSSSGFLSDTTELETISPTPSSSNTSSPAVSVISPPHSTPIIMCHTPPNPSPTPPTSHPTPSILISTPPSSPHFTPSNSPIPDTLPFPTSYLMSLKQSPTIPVTSPTPRELKPSYKEDTVLQPTNKTPSCPQIQTIQTRSEDVTTPLNISPVDLDVSTPAHSKLTQSNMSDFRPSTPNPEVVLMSQSVPFSLAQSQNDSIAMAPSCSLFIAPISSCDSNKYMPYYSTTSSATNVLYDAKCIPDVNNSYMNTITSPLNNPTHNMAAYPPIPLVNVTPSSYAVGMVTAPQPPLPHQPSYLFRPLMGVPQATPYQSSQTNSFLGLHNIDNAHVRSPVFAPPPYYVYNNNHCVDQDMSKMMSWSPVTHLAQIPTGSTCNNHYQSTVHTGHSSTQHITASAGCTLSPNVFSVDIVRQHTDPVTNNSLQSSSNGVEMSREEISMSQNSPLDITSNSNHYNPPSPKCEPNSKLSTSYSLNNASSEKRLDLHLDTPSEQMLAEPELSNIHNLSGSSHSVENCLLDYLGESGTSSLKSEISEAKNDVNPKETIRLLDNESNNTIKTSGNKTTAASDSTQCLNDSRSSNENLKNSLSQTDLAITAKPSSTPTFFHGAFPGNIDIHVHPTINIPAIQTDSIPLRSPSSHRKHRRSRQFDSPATKHTDGSSYSSSSYSDYPQRSRSDPEKKSNTTVDASNSSRTRSHADSNSELDYPRLVRKIEKLVQSLQRKETLESKIPEIPIDKAIRNPSSIRNRHGMFTFTESTESSYSQSTKGLVKSTKSMTSASSRTSVVEMVRSDSNTLALLQTLKIFQNLSNSDDDKKKKKKDKNGLKADRYHQLIEILDHFESRLSSHQLKDVKHDLHDLARNLKRQMKTNRNAVRDEIENRCQLFTSERFTKGMTSDLKVEETGTASGSHQTSGKGSQHKLCRRGVILKNSTALDVNELKPKEDSSHTISSKTVDSTNTAAFSFSSSWNQRQNCEMARVTHVDQCFNGRQLLPHVAVLPDTQSTHQNHSTNKDINPDHPFLQMIRFLSEESVSTSHKNKDISFPDPQPNQINNQIEMLPVVSTHSGANSTQSADNNKADVEFRVMSPNVRGDINADNVNRSEIIDRPSMSTKPIFECQTCYNNKIGPEVTTHKSELTNHIDGKIDMLSVTPDLNNDMDVFNVDDGSSCQQCIHKTKHQHNKDTQISSQHDSTPNICKSISPSLTNVSSVSPQTPPSEILSVFPELVSAFTPIHPAPKSDNSQDLSSYSVADVSPSADVTGTSRSDVTEPGTQVKTTTTPEMEADSHHTFQMDREFDKHLADMKPHVLKLPHKADRQKCAVWIKKLCEPQGSSLSARKTRNLYAQLMLQMLKKGALSSPFDLKPSDGPLQPLPSYVSVYFDDPLNGFQQAERIPDWVEGELGDTIGSSGLPRSLGNPAATSTWVSGIGDLTERPHSSMGHTLDKDPSLSPIRHADKIRSKGYSADDMSIEVSRSPSPPRHRPIRGLRSPDREKRQLPDVKVKGTRDEGSRTHHHHQHQHQHDYPLTSDNDWHKHYNANMSTASSVSLPKGTTFYDDLPSYHKPTDREVAVRTKMIEAKFHEEKLKLQQKHDASVQKILDRKNAEIEDVKSHYRSKSKDIEDANNKMEKKVQTLLKEVEYVTQNKDKQIAEMKKLAEDSNETRRNEFEKRLHDVMAEFEQEKFSMQKQHTQNIQEILDDTNSRLQRMETEYSHQTTTTTNVIKELESRVQQLMTEVDSTLNQRSAVEKEKNEALARLEKLTDDHERLKEKSSQMERQHHVATETQEHNLRSLKNKTEASLEFLKQENAIAASKAADTIKELEDKIEQLKKAVKETEEQRHRQIRELEQVHQQDKLHAENLHDKQVRNMKKEMDQQDSDWSKKLSKADKTIKEREEEATKLKEQKQQQSIQAEQALDDFKMQVEKNQARIYDEMKQQMEQVEGDLTKSKQAREKQAKEFTRQMEEMGFKHQHEIAEIKMNMEGEKSQLMREFHIQKEFIISEHDKEVDNLKDVHRTEVQAMEARLKERHDKADKAALDSERTIRELREELVQANQLRKQQLVELGLLREEEKQKVHRDHEAELARQRTELEQHRLELQKSHSTEMEAVLEKTNERLKSIEKEYADRGSKSAESIAELQNVVLQLRGDIKKSRENSDEKLAELKHQYEEEKQNLRKHYSQNLSTIQKEVEANRNRARNVERQLQTEESDHEEKMTHLQLQYEERIRGLMSSDLRQELESTISSLKAQVSSLQQRSLMLQEELDAKNRNSLGPFGSRTSSPIKSSV